MATFEDRMQQLYPGAVILRAGREPEVEGQFLQIYPVSANKDLNHMIYQRMKISQAAREYALTGNPQMFATTSRQPQADVPITDQVVEKEIYTTAEPFPTILRRSEIVGTENVTLSPLEAAVERTTRKTQEILSLEKRIASGEDDGAMNRLSDELLLSVDPDSDSSVSRYRVLLPKSEQGDAASAEVDFNMPEEEEPLDPMQNALKVALLDHALTIRRCLHLYTSSAYLATKAELIPRFEATFEQELAILFPNKEDLMAEPSRRSSMRDNVRTSNRADVKAVAGAPLDGAAEQQQQPPERRQSRRRSFQFLRRVASTSREPNGVTDADDGGRHSRQSSQSRTRSESLTRRLSFFRSEQKQQDAGGRSDSRASNNRQADSTAQSSTLKKRLSFLKAAGNSGLTRGENAY
jgi:hypothetical protein